MHTVCCSDWPRKEEVGLYALNKNIHRDIFMSMYCVEGSIVGSVLH